MTVEQLIRELVVCGLDTEVYVSLDDKEKIGKVLRIESWHGDPILHFDDWRNKKKDGSGEKL